MRRTPDRPADGDPGRWRVVLLHGLGRSALSFAGLARWLRTRGYGVVNVGYPSRRAEVERLAEHVRARLEPGLERDGRGVHFVTHSLGGIVLRQMLAQEGLPGLGRVVMLCPPSRGSELADRLGRYSLPRAVMGPALRQLGTGSDGLPGRLPPPTYPVGVIAGSRAVIPFFSRLLDGPHDGIVTVERARLEGMADFLVVRHGHTYPMNVPEVRAQIVHFLERGRFRKGE